MKTLFAIFIILFSSHFVYANEDMLLQSQEVKMCTMDYNPVCWTNGVTYGNMCSAWENTVAYKWECNDYVNNAYYTTLENKYSVSLKKELWNYDTNKLGSSPVDRIFNPHILALWKQKLTTEKIVEFETTK